MSAEQQPHLSPDAYLDGETRSEVRHEYLHGELYAMAGASLAHNTITLNIAGSLRPQLRGSGCRAYSLDVKVWVREASAFYYPDLLVTCDPRDHTERAYIEHPAVIIEVLSTSTEAIDRGRKLRHYQSLASLREYLLVAQDQKLVEIYSRGDSGEWIYRSYGPGDNVPLHSTGSILTLDTIYEAVTLEEHNQPAQT